MPAVSWRLFRFRLPLVRPLLSGASVRQGWLVQVRGANAIGWGEVAPLPGFSREPPEVALDALKDLLSDLSVVSEMSFPVWREQIASMLVGVPASVRWGLELALAQWQARRAGKRLDDWLVPDPLPRVSINALVPANWQEQPEGLAAIQAAGYRVVKVKVRGYTPEEAVQRVRQLREVLGPGVALRVDANRAWSLQEALAFAEAVADLGLDYIEEPLCDSSKLQTLLRGSPVPIALDETLVEQSETPLSCWKGIAAVVLKPALIGGLLQAWQRAVEAKALGIKVVWSAAFETGVGTRGLLALAAASRSTTAAGLDPYRWLADDVVQPRLCLQPSTSVAEALKGPWQPNLAVLEEIDV